ncbi:MAG: flagellar protein FlgN [Syntrophorhabdaceae bacterium]|nr:flagellar protein FlgN [Syntrophorhabdaceae bacterium]
MSHLSSIKVILREQEACCKTLVGLLQRERGYLVDLDVRAVEELTKEKDTLLLRLRFLDEERQRLVSVLSKEWSGQSGKELTLCAMAERAGDTELSEMRLKLVSLAQSINDLNSFNRYLVDRSLSNARSARGVFEAFGDWSPEYAVSGTLLSKET